MHLCTSRERWGGEENKSRQSRCYRHENLDDYNHNLNNNEDDCCCEMLVVASSICDCGGRARIARHVSAIDATSPFINVGSSTKIGHQLSVHLRCYVRR